VALQLQYEFKNVPPIAASRLKNRNLLTDHFQSTVDMNRTATKPKSCKSSAVTMISTFAKLSPVSLLILPFVAAAAAAAVAVSVEQISFASIDSAARGNLCIQGTLLVTVRARSLANCAVSCVSFQNCSGFNIFDDGSFGTVSCQLFMDAQSILLAVRPGCRGYQVCSASIK
jgi:hypothetical protein